MALNQQMAVADALREIKASSSKWIHDLSPELEHFAWQSGYAAFGVTYSQLRVVETYIKSQAEHHRTVSFQDEILALLKRHDERYVWD